MPTPLNRATLVGRLGSPPTLEHTRDGSLCILSVVTDGEHRGTPLPERHRVVAWGDLAETCAALREGVWVCVEGRMQTRQWADRYGVHHLTGEVVASVVREAEE